MESLACWDFFVVCFVSQVKMRSPESFPSTSLSSPSSSCSPMAFDLALPCNPDNWRKGIKFLVEDGQAFLKGVVGADDTKKAKH